MLAALERLVLWALFWPILLPWVLAKTALELPLRAEEWLAAPLGAYVGLAQGGAFGAATIAEMVLSRGGLSKLMLGYQGECCPQRCKARAGGPLPTQAS